MRSPLLACARWRRGRLVDELAGALHVGLVASRGEAEGQRRQQAQRGNGRQRSRQSPGVRQHAGDEGSRSQAEQVQEQRYHRCAGGAHGDRGHVDHDRRHRADGAGQQEAAEGDEPEPGLRGHLQAEERSAKGGSHHQQRGDAKQRHRVELGVRAAGAGTVDDRPPHHATDSAEKHDERRLDGRLVGREAVLAVEKARQPRPDGREHEHLRRTAHAHPHQGARANQRLEDGLPGAARRAHGPILPGRELHGSVVAHLEVQQGQHQSGKADHAERGLPAPARRDEAAEYHAEHGAHRGCGEEAGHQGTAHARREMARDQGRASRAVAGFAQADQPACGQQLAVAACEHARDRRQAPDGGHHDDALDPAGAVGEQRHGQCPEADRDRYHRDQRPELLVGQAPVLLHVGKERDDHLAVDIVEHHQRESHREGEPGLAAAEQVAVGSPLLLI